MEGWLEYASNGRMAGVCQEWKDNWSMPGMVGWLEYARNGRIAGVCQEWKYGWSMPGSERMAGVCQEWKDGLSMPVGGRIVYQEVEVWRRSMDDLHMPV